MKYYAQEWDRYTTGANYINRLFTYLNRHWVKRERDEGRKGIYPVYTVCLPLEYDEITIKLTRVLPARSGSMENAILPPHPGEEPKACERYSQTYRATAKWRDH